MAAREGERVGVDAGPRRADRGRRGRRRGGCVLNARRRRAALALGALAGALGAAACSLRSLDYLQAGLDAGAASDARAGDASAGDATPAPDADAGTWCAQQSPVPDFCADYDEDAAYTAFVEGTPSIVSPVATGAATFSLDPAGFSPPRGLLLGSPGGAYMRATYDFPSLPAQPSVRAVRLAWAMRVHAMPSAGEIDVVSVSIASGNGAADEHVYVSIEDGQGDLLADGTASSTFSVPAPDSWAQLELRLDLAGKSAALFIDGTSVASVGSIPYPAAQSATFRLGIETYPEAGPASATFDDVLFAVQ